MKSDSKAIRELNEASGRLWVELSKVLDRVLDEFDPKIDSIDVDAREQIRADELFEEIDTRDEDYHERQLSEEVRWKILSERYDGDFDEYREEIDTRDEDYHKRQLSEEMRWEILSKRYGDFDDIERPESLALETMVNRESRFRKLMSLRRAVAQRDFAAAQDAWTDLSAFLDVSESGYLGLGLGDTPQLITLLDSRESIDRLMEGLDDHVPTMIYTPAQRTADIVTPKLMVSLSTAFAHQIARDSSLVYSLSPREFEEFVAEIFASFGYKVELTARTRDGGKDIIAIGSQNDILTKLVIECKRYAPHRRVGLSHVRELYTVKALERASKAILATTSFFSRDARQMERRLVYELELKDFDAVTRWAKQYSDFLRGIRGGQRA